MNWYLEVLKKYTVFNGRARRSEYWYFFLFNLIISVVLAVLDHLMGMAHAAFGMGMLGTLYSLAVLLPGLAVSVRRLHDTDRSGWWLLIAFIPLIGAIVLLIFMVMDGSAGDNRFGSDPKQIAEPASL